MEPLITLPAQILLSIVGWFVFISLEIFFVVIIMLFYKDKDNGWWLWVSVYSLNMILVFFLAMHMAGVIVWK